MAAETNNQIAQIGSILQKILVELERVKREQSSLRQVVTGIQQQQLQQQQHQLQQQHLQQLQQLQQQEASRALIVGFAFVLSTAGAPFPLDSEIVDVAGDLHRASLGETEVGLPRFSQTYARRHSGISIAQFLLMSC